MFYSVCCQNNVNLNHCQFQQLTQRQRDSARQKAVNKGKLFNSNPLHVKFKHTLPKKASPLFPCTSVNHFWKTNRCHCSYSNSIRVSLRTQKSDVPSSSVYRPCHLIDDGWKTFFRYVKWTLVKTKRHPFTAYSIPFSLQTNLEEADESY